MDINLNRVVEIIRRDQPLVFERAVLMAENEALQIENARLQAQVSAQPAEDTPPEPQEV